ncbi:APC family permease [Arthrobacter sp. 2MCAF14]|uniref:APC family permease n=1 Tax=Arthrobacter sp. 2MCAF14 TaxID=3232982 RepID=UPI003F9212DD
MTTQPSLTRALKLPSLVLFGLAYLTPLIVLAIFGVIAETTGGASPSAYLVAMVAMLFTAQSYGRMAVAYPMAGSAYTYIRRSIDSRIGFLAGWAVLLDYLFLPMVIWLIGGSYLTAQFPDIPIGVWIVAFIAITTLLNVVGVKVADKANYLLMAFQLLVIVLFVALSVGTLVSTSGASALISTAPFFNDTSSFDKITAGAAIAAYSFLGFDAVSTLTEETIEPKKTVPKAIMLVALIGGAIFVVVSYTTQLIHPGGVFDDSASAASDIALKIGGQFFGAVFLAGLVVSQFASGLAAQASASRLAPALRHGPGFSPAEEGLRRAEQVLPHAGVQPGHHRGGGTHRHVPGRCHLDVVHQLRRLYGLHTRQHLGHCLLPAPTTLGATAQRIVLRGHAGGGRDHRRFPALPAGLEGHHAGADLALRRRRGAGHHHQGVPEGTTGNGDGGKRSRPGMTTDHSVSRNTEK